jgi:outer membrane protein assembly factor BamB
MKRRPAFIIMLLTAFAILTNTVSAENWAQWRGPFLNGSTSEKELPTTWSKTENVLWVVKMPGPGQSTPIIWEDRVFVTAIEEDSEKMWAICLNRADGRELWRYEVGLGFFGRTGNTGASPSPVVDGERVYFLYGTTDFLAFDMGEGTCRSTISASHGQLFLRTAENLYCIGRGTL